MRETDTDTGCGTVRCERGITPAAVVRVAANGDRREAAQAGLGSESEIPPSALYAAQAYQKEQPLSLRVRTACA
jgi:hypothetical protein